MRVFNLQLGHEKDDCEYARSKNVIAAPPAFQLPPFHPATPVTSFPAGATTIRSSFLPFLYSQPAQRSPPKTHFESFHMHRLHRFVPHKKKGNLEGKRWGSVTTFLFILTNIQKAKVASGLPQED